MIATGTNVFNNLLVQRAVVFSAYLERDVIIDVYLPKENTGDDQVSLLLFNDGQDLLKMDFAGMLDCMIYNREISPLMCIGIHCGSERKMEYGISYSADYMGRGAKAGLYTKFIFEELIPYIRRAFDVLSFKEKCFAGFSLGGLSALDIAWNHSAEFSKIGVFSGALWWRRKAFEDGYTDENDRLMHLQVRHGGFHPWMKFFIQCGALDEKSDRNGNGVIDSIDDALDLIIELKAKGYTDDHIHYEELADGRHDVATWARVMPSFIKWIAER